jgi:hypothetical protein
MSPCALWQQDSPVGECASHGSETAAGGTLVRIIAEPSMSCAELANILTLAAAGSHRTVNGAQSTFAKCGKPTLGVANLLRWRRAGVRHACAVSSPPLRAAPLPNRARRCSPARAGGSAGVGCGGRARTRPQPNGIFRGQAPQQSRSDEMVGSIRERFSGKSPEQRDQYRDSLAAGSAFRSIRPSFVFAIGRFQGNLASAKSDSP